MNTKEEKTLLDRLRLWFNNSAKEEIEEIKNVGFGRYTVYLLLQLFDLAIWLLGFHYLITHIL